jgi:hypothetical protein
MASFFCGIGERPADAGSLFQDGIRFLVPVLTRFIGS